MVERARTVTDYLQADHERLDALVPEVVRLAHAGAFSDARSRFDAFVRGLERHIDVEEEVLFPTFEEMTGMTSGPTAVMRAEHVDLREHLKRAVAALAAGDAAAADDAIGQLTTLLASHNMKEEQMLYPMTDRALGTPEACEALVRRIEAF